MATRASFHTPWATWVAWLVGLLCVVLGSPAQAEAARAGSFPVIVLGESAPNRLDIGTQMDVLVDPSRALTLEQVTAPRQAWQVIDRPSPNFGFTTDAHWLRFRLRNDTAAPMSRLLELPIPFLDDVRLFHLHGGQIQVRYALGDEQPFAQRVVRHRNFIMPLRLEPGINEVYLRLASAGTIEAPLRLWEPAAFHAAATDEHLVQGVVVGILLIMVVYNLFVYVSTRDINYVYYICFVASYLGFHLTLTGYSFAYLWPEAVGWNRFAISTFVASSALFACLFTDSFLKLRQFSRKAHRLVNGISVLCAVLLVGTFVLPYSLTIRLGAALALPIVTSALALGYWRWWLGARFARFYCIAWTAILIGLAILNASKHGWIAINMWTENASQIGIVLLVTLLSFTLADQINNDRSLRLNAQAVALSHERNARESQQALMRATEDANRELEQRVDARTRELHDTLEQLKVANAQLHRLSTTDSLTQLNNRARFDAAAAEELRRAERRGSSLALILFDIDHFKRINDTYGHLAGDACLRALAQALQPRVQRAGDLLARYGGEEFVVILTEADEAQAVAFAESMRQAVMQIAVPFENQTLRFTASFGVAAATVSADMEVADYLSAADQALYRAKTDGRNTVRVATPVASLVTGTA